MKFDTDSQKKKYIFTYFNTNLYICITKPYKRMTKVTSKSYYRNLPQRRLRLITNKNTKYYATSTLQGLTQIIV